MSRVIGKLWPSSLTGQMIALTFLALVAAQVISVAIFLDERHHAIRAAERAQILSRVAAVVRLLQDTPPELSERIARAASGPRLRLWLDDNSIVASDDRSIGEDALHARLSGLLSDSAGTRILVRTHSPRGRVAQWLWHQFEDDDEHDDHHEGKRRWRDHDGHDWGDSGHDDHFRGGRERPIGLTISVELDDGRWLNCETALPLAPMAWNWVPLPMMLGLALLLSVIIIFSVRRITRPMRALAMAAEEFGRGQSIEPLAERGPQDVRDTIQAFNNMKDRLDRFVSDRTRMLAAIGHDLRTPITTLRLRAEFVEDPDNRAKILEILDEMEEMTEATIAFVREDAAKEDTRQVDLAALVQSICDDLTDGGSDVMFGASSPMPYACRPVALKRALTNLIRNAIAYGTRARVSATRSEDRISIVVDDDGPGVPRPDLDRVFEPFLRLEASRNRETGGVGLGLAIARSILRGHGGDVILSNRPEGGLRATMWVPVKPPK